MTVGRISRLDGEVSEKPTTSDYLIKNVTNELSRATQPVYYKGRGKTLLNYRNI